MNLRSWTGRGKLRLSLIPILPALESLLADREDHRILHETVGELPADLRIKAPTYRLDLGELHCLSVGRGTLTDEERFLINNHIVQTIIMLRALPVSYTHLDVYKRQGRPPRWCCGG